MASNWLQGKEKHVLWNMVETGQLICKFSLWQTSRLHLASYTQTQNKAISTVLNHHTSTHWN